MQFKFDCKLFVVELVYKFQCFDTASYETGILLAWWPVRNRRDGQHRFRYHWREVIHTTCEAVADGHPIRTTP